MKRLPIYIFLLIPLMAWAAITTINTGGDWNDTGIWTLAEIGDKITEDVDMSNDIGDVYIRNTFDYTIGVFDMKNNNTLNIESGGSLTVGSSTTTKNMLGGSSLTTLNIIGNLEVWGNFTIQGNANIDVSGTMIVHGNFTVNNVATVNIDGTLNIGGNISVGTSSTLTGTGTVFLSGSCTGPDTFCDSGPLYVAPPVITGCPANINQSASSTSCDASVTWTEPIAINKTGTVSLTSTHSPGDIFPVGTTTVTYTAVDAASGKSTTCIFDIIVTDDTYPIISNCPTDIAVSLSGTGCTESINWATPIASDNCQVASFTNNYNSGDAFPLGTTTVTYVATDNAGNSSQCSFNITVTDITNPVITGCPTDISVNLGSNGTCTEIVSWTEPIVSDNCQMDSFINNFNPGDSFPLGTTVVTYIATDISGNSSQCSFNITVTDNTNPVITNCPTDIDVSFNSSGGCTKSVDWAVPIASDNCGVASFTSNYNPGDEFPIGTSIVTYVATDSSGNYTQCSFNITVTDNSSPVISSCPTDISVGLSSSNGCTEIVNWAEPIASDNCQLESFTNNYNPGDEFPVGTTIVTYVATNSSGNSTQCSFSVTVNDNTLPELSSCPDDIIIDLNGQRCDIKVSWTPPITTDNCEISSLTSTSEPGDLFSSGTTEVTYTAVDIAGNTSTCSFNVVVNDPIEPKFDFCPAEVLISEFDLDSQTAVVTWQEPQASDNCGVPVVTSNFNSGDSFPPGVTSVIYSATDNSGNSVTCEFEVEVIGNKRPVGLPHDLAVVAGIENKICLEVTDPDGDALAINDIAADEMNGIIEWSKDSNDLCFNYTAFDDFSEQQLLIATICDDGVPEGCIDIEIRLNVSLDLTLTINKAFTPNNDNINDVWIIDNIQNYHNNKVTVYDRLGGLVYSAKGYNNLDIVWDGRSNKNGQDVLPNGTYFYIIDLGDEQSLEKGSIELVR